MIYGILILVIIISVSLELNTISKLKKERESAFQDYLKKREADVQLRTAELLKKYNAKKAELNTTLIALNNKCKEVKNTLNLLKDNLKQSIEDKERFIDSELKLYKSVETRKIANELASNKQNADECFDSYVRDIDERRSVIQKEFEEAKKVLEDYRKRRDAVNEAIARERKIQDSVNFYRVILTDNDLADMKLLKEMAPNARNKDIIPKVIWEMILKRPVSEMIKRITEGKEISGIYKVTNINTGESYIGKTTNIQKRWTDHCKTAIGLEAAATSTFHTRLSADGIQNYTWEILEEVEKDKLGEREKYYIDFYDTKNYGLNQKNGG